MRRALVDLARRGDEEAFADLARALGDRLMTIAFRILRDVDRAGDAVQQTLVTAWRELPTLRDDDRFERAFRRLSPRQGAIFVLHHSEPGRSPSSGIIAPWSSISSR